MFFMLCKFDLISFWKLRKKRYFLKIFIFQIFTMKKHLGNKYKFFFLCFFWKMCLVKSVKIVEAKTNWKTTATWVKCVEMCQNLHIESTIVRLELLAMVSIWDRNRSSPVRRAARNHLTWNLQGVFVGEPWQNFILIFEIAFEEQWITITEEYQLWERFDVQFLCSNCVFSCDKNDSRFVKFVINIF